MNKLYFFILLMLCMPSVASAEEFTIVLNGVTQTITGSSSTSGDDMFIFTEDMTYKVTGTNTAILGDLNDDKDINVLDLTYMIDMIIDRDFSVIADMNKDKELSVLDATALIDAILDNIKETIVLSYIVEEVPDDWIVGGQTYERVEQG